MSRARRLSGGLSRALRAAAVRAARSLFERGQLDTSAAAGRPDYAPTGWLFLRRALRGVRIGPQDVVLDLGSGLGRVVAYVARRYPAQRVIGVELAPEHTRVAAENLQRLDGRLRCGDVELTTADAARYAIPDDVTVVYLYNPFGPDVLRTVAAALIASLDRNPRELAIVYAHPKAASVLLETGRLHHVRTSRGLRPERIDRWASLFRSKPAVPGRRPP